MDTAQWPQGIGVVKPMESSSRPTITERKPRPQKELALNCPRCSSTNTKFCYYNNYSLSQPRYFCKTCRRYWTEGGSLRNVPVGGGSRKNKRSSSSSSITSSIPSSPVKKLSDLKYQPNFTHLSSQNPKTHEAQDLNLSYPPPITNDFSNLNPNPNPNPRGLGSFMQISCGDQSNNSAIYPSGFSLTEFKPNLGFSLEGFENGYGSLQGVHGSTTSDKLFLPFVDLKQTPGTAELEQNRGQGESNGYWSGIIGGGSW
ncbi:hypothetical protein NMG60_11020116 [Bertholletia excelsa]